jgi:hypothetical protein
VAPPIWVVGQVLSASDVDNWLVPSAAVKTADQSVTSSTVLVNDTELSLPLAASVTYLFQCYIDYEGGTGGASDIQWLWSLPAGSFMRYTNPHRNLAGTPVAGDTSTGTATDAASTGGAGVLRALQMMGSIVCGVTAGTLQFRWAQNTSSATSTIVHAQSCVMLQRVT